MENRIDLVLTELKILRIDLQNAFDLAVQQKKTQEATSLQEDLLKVIKAIHALED